MNGEQDQRMERGSLPDRSKDQEGKDRSFFQANGLDHFTFAPKTVITWGLLSVLAGLVFATVSVYQSFGSDVDQRISVHPTIIEMKINFKNSEEKINKIESKQESLICQFNKGKNCR